MAEVRKKGKSGQRGIKKVDRVQDTELFISDYKDGNGNSVRLGKIRLAHEINNSIKDIAYELSVSKADLVRRLFIDFIKDYKEAKATGATKLFTPEESIEGWLHRRYDFFQLLTEIKKQASYLEESKSPEVKILSRQINLLAQMLNLTNKNVI